MNEDENIVEVAESPADKRAALRRKKKVLLPFLQTLKEISPKHRAVILRHLDDQSCDDLYRTITNALQHSDVPVKKQEKLRKELAQHKNALRYLARKKYNPEKRKEKLSQLGGFPLTAVLGAAIPLLIDLITRRK